MSVLAVGVNHRSAPTSVLERLALTGDDLRKALHELTSTDSVDEAVVLSTCNRVEVYVDSGTFHGGVAEVSELLSRVSGLALEDLQTSLYPLHGARAAQHLFAVACGLDSLLLGEAQIQGQVREAFRIAQEEGTVGRTLGELFRSALRVGRRARTETTIDAAGRSLVGVGLRLAADAVGSLEGRSALLVGAGSTAALAGSLLRKAGVADLVVANRSQDHGRRLAVSLGGRAVGLDELEPELARADVTVSATAATGLVVLAEDAERALASREGRPLFLLDLALPRDVDPSVCALPGVTVADLETLRSALAGEQVGADAAAVRRIVDEEVGAYVGWQRAREVAPTVVALRSKADGVVRDELDRLTARAPYLDDRSRAEVEQTVRRVVDKILHAPTVRVKELAEAPGGDSYAEALRELFGLGQGSVAAVTDPVPPGFEPTS